MEKKGLIYGLRAFANVAQRHRGLRLDCILCAKSKDNLRLVHALKSEAAARGVADRVTWYSGMPYDEYLRFAELAHLYLAPSVIAANGDAEGGCPVAVIELSAAGMPVLASRHCDIPEVVLDGVSGYLAPEKDVNALTDRLESLVTHPEKWPEMGRAGRAHVEAEYNAAFLSGEAGESLRRVAIILRGLPDGNTAFVLGVLVLVLEMDGTTTGPKSLRDPT